MQLPFKEGLELIVKGYEKQAEGYLWQQWLALLPNMTQKNFIPFPKFKKKAFRNMPKRGKEKKESKPTGELISFAERVKQADLKKKGGSAK